MTMTTTYIRIDTAVHCIISGISSRKGAVRFANRAAQRILARAGISGIPYTVAVAKPGYRWHTIGLYGD